MEGRWGGIDSSSQDSRPPRLPFGEVKEQNSVMHTGASTSGRAVSKATGYFPVERLNSLWKQSSKSSRRRIQRLLLYLRALWLEAGTTTLSSYKPTPGFPLGGDPMARANVASSSPPALCSVSQGDDGYLNLGLPICFSILNGSSPWDWLLRV